MDIAYLILDCVAFVWLFFNLASAPDMFAKVAYMVEGEPWAVRAAAYGTMLAYVIGTAYPMALLAYDLLSRI